MRKHLVILGLGLSLSAHAGWFSSTPAKAKSKSSQIAAVEVSPQNSVQAEIKEYSDNSTHIRLAPTMNVIFTNPLTFQNTSNSSNSATGFGLGVDLLFNTSAHLQMGAELGLVKFTGANGESGLMVPILYTLLYQFNPGGISPYIGFSAGVEIAPVNKHNNTYYSDGSVASTKTQTYILPLPTLIFRPGIDIPISKSVSFFAEAKMGLLLILPFVAPQAGVSIGF